MHLLDRPGAVPVAAKVGAQTRGKRVTVLSICLSVAVGGGRGVKK